MDIEKLARKLEPLMPDQVTRWLRIRDTADAEMRDLIDKQIVVTAHRVLGDFRRKILLSLPSQHNARGAIHLGTVLYEKEKWPFGLRTSELLQNLAIFGRSGAGKTNATFCVLQQLAAKGIPFLFLDWKRTARHLLPSLKGKINVYTPGRSISSLAFNPFIAPPGLESRVYINQVVDVMADAYTLGDGARSILQRSLAALVERGIDAPTVSEVLQEVENLPMDARSRLWKVSAVRALQSLDFADLTMKDATSQERLAERLLQESTIIELDALSHSGKKFLIPLLCLWLYYVRLASPVREQLQLALFVEEAHHAFYRSDRSKESLMNMLLRQCREVGIAMIVVDQHPSLISSAALGNTYTTLCLNLKDPADLRKAGALSLVDDEDRRYFSMLPVGQAIVKLQDRWRLPFLIRIPLVNVAKGGISDQALRAYVGGKGTRFNASGVGGGEFSRVTRVPLDDRALNPEELAFLEDVAGFKDDGVKIRYRRLGLSAGRGTRLKERLVAAGWLESAVVPLGKTRRVLLRLTPAGETALGLDAPPNTNHRGSLAHEYWKRFYARRFVEQGYDVRLEAPRQGGRVDVLAVKNGERVAIEIETGSSDVVANVRNCLRSGFEQVVVVATDSEALAKIERQLADPGLIIFGRVEVVRAAW